MKKPNRRFYPPNPSQLANVALAYLARFAASEASLRRVLDNRIRRAALLNPAFADDKEAQENLRTVIETLIEKHRKTGVLNDAAYAETKISSLRRAGRSARAIRQKLGHAGIAREIVAHALISDEVGSEEAEFQAARQLARRRRLGAYRTTAADDDRKRKDLATLARAGFSLSIAKRALLKDDET